ncbi:hypothetical protein JCM8097_006008 [Rhodosporidiobolus ruineniae]
MREEEQEERRQRMVEDERLARQLAEQESEAQLLRRPPPASYASHPSTLVSYISCCFTSLDSPSRALAGHLIQVFLRPRTSFNMSAPPMSGLGITFDVSTSPELQHAAHHQHPYRGHPAQAPHLRRTLHHSMSVDEGLNRQYRHEPMVRQPSEDSAGSGQKRVRIAVGTPEVLGGGKGQHDLPYLHQHSQLSPLSDFDLSSASDTGSSQPFSPASLSDLPSSTESGAYPTFYPISSHAPSGPTAPGMEAAQSRPYPPLNPAANAYQPLRPSRLPAFLQERQQNHGLARPHSMMELSQAYHRPAAVLRGPRAEEEHVEYADYKSSPEVEQRQQYGDESPESVPSSAGGFQRRQLERQLQEQKDLLEAERRRLRASEGRPRERSAPGVESVRPLVHQRSRSLSAQEMRQLAAAEQAREPQPQVLRRSQSQGVLQDFGDSALAGEDDDERGTVISLDNRPLSGPAEVTRQNTLLTAGASTVRRRKELSRLLAPSSKKGSVGLPSITGSPTPSQASSAVTSSTRPAPSRTSAAPTTASPVILEQAKGSSRARVELDLVLETPLVVEGGLLKGKLELKVRKPKDKEGELWIGKPKIRVIGFEELASSDARYVFFHHAESISTVQATNAPSLVLPCFDTPPDEEGFCRAKLGQHAIPVRMSLPVGKGAKGPWKGKQGVVRYIAIASVKLKSKTGTNRSIAHFYRHVDVFPYLNPAVALAPASKPLQAEAAKSLFLGGNGKVTLKASMHRETWVAGQRCYCDVSVINDSHKKIKTLTLALVRTTTIYRPSAVEGGPSHTQSTRKKVAETTLEMGKKATKGVTAKGSWMGVDAGESSDFSHSLLVPSDALSISRGRHIEVSYAVKVSVGGSLSTDVAADIPVRIVDFLSLDPPPGHVGASPLVEAPARPLARQWSSTQLRTDAAPRRDGPLMNRMISVDSLRLEDLNSGRGPSRLVQPTLSRVASLSSIRTDDLPRAEPLDQQDTGTEHFPPGRSDRVPHALARTEALVDRALQRQIQHQASLDCISSAIASATARRQQGLRRQPSALSSIVEPEQERSWMDSPEYEGDFTDQLHCGGGELPYVASGSFTVDDLRVQLDDLDDVPDDPVYLNQQASPAGIEEDIADSDSEGELDAIMQSHFSDEDDDDEDMPSTRSSYVPPSPRRTDRPASPTKVTVRPRSSSFAQPSSPVKTRAQQESPRQQRSPEKRSPDKFGFATPSSPIKACVELPDESNSAPPTRAPRPLPALPTAPALSKQPSGSSLRRQPGMIRKTPSQRSVRSVASSVELRTHPAKVALPPSRSPSLASPMVSPVLATVRTRPPMSPTTMAVPPSSASPRRVVKTPSPALRATRSMADLHDIRASSSSSFSSSDMPPPPVPSSVTRQPTTLSTRPGGLPSVVKNKVAALETRQAQLTRLATTTKIRARVSSGVHVPPLAQASLARADSVLSNASSVAPSEVSFRDITGLSRANSVVSFKAPLLRRGGGYEDAPPVPALPPQ